MQHKKMRFHKNVFIYYEDMTFGQVFNLLYMYTDSQENNVFNGV